MIFFQNWKNTKCKMIWTGPRIGGSSCWLLLEFLFRERKKDWQKRSTTCLHVWCGRKYLFRTPCAFHAWRRWRPCTAAGGSAHGGKSLNLWIRSRAGGQITVDSNKLCTKHADENAAANLIGRLASSRSLCFGSVCRCPAHDWIGGQHDGPRRRVCSESDTPFAHALSSSWWRVLGTVAEEQV